jgi:DNA polymerase-1
MFRYAFDAPEGKDIINSDYTGQETFIMADKSQEKNLLHLLRTGGDSHCFVAKAIDPNIAELSDDDIKEFHSDKRQTAKSANFAIQFGGTGFTIAQNLGLTQEEGDSVYNAYFTAFPDLDRYFKEVKSQTKRLGYVLINNVTGRKSFFDKATGPHDRDKRALNAPVQGTAADMTKLAAIKFFRWVEENNKYNEAKLTLLVHDEIMGEVNKEISNIVANEISRCMVEAGKVFCKTIDLKADAAIVDYWKH